METTFETRTRAGQMNSPAEPKSPEEHKEGELAKQIEQETAKIPSDVFLWASVTAMSASLLLKLAGKNRMALFIGQWASPFLLFGIYNKIVKVEGHDKTDNE